MLAPYLRIKTHLRSGTIHLCQVWIAQQYFQDIAIHLGDFWRRFMKLVHIMLISVLGDTVMYLELGSQIVVPFNPKVVGLIQFYAVADACRRSHRGIVSLR